MIAVQVMASRFVFCIIALFQGLASDIVLARVFWRVKADMISATTGWMYAPAADTFDNSFFGHLELNDKIKFDLFIFERICLGDGPWETVKEVALSAIVLLKSIFD